MGTEMDWYNEPPMWIVHGNTISIWSGRAKNRLWRTTHYGFMRDNGHFYHHGIVSDFLVEVKVSGANASLYDQTGFMVRVDEAHWVKGVIEFFNGVQQVSAVVTREYSYWSVVPLPSNPAAIWLHLMRHGPAIEIRYALEGMAGCP